jgi:hypothetical protein
LRRPGVEWSAMQPALFQLVAVATSLLLALPPGWCCTPIRQDRTPASPEPARCCHQTAADRPPQPEQPPARPNAECCCQRDATVPEQPVQPTGPAALVLPLLADAPTLLAGPGHGDTVGIPRPPDPRLHVLQCVWRC